jgi:hypothetical protein
MPRLDGILTLDFKNKEMTEREMFEKSFQRPKDYFKLTGRKQWEIDEDLGILDWVGEDLSEEDIERFNVYFGIKTKIKK